MHGVGARWIELAFQAFGLPPFIPVKSQLQPDPDFPTVKYPNPEEGKGALVSFLSFSLFSHWYRVRIVSVKEENGHDAKFEDDKTAHGKKRRRMVVESVTNSGLNICEFQALVKQPHSGRPANAPRRTRISSAVNLFIKVHVEVNTSQFVKILRFKGGISLQLGQQISKV
jgi:hypothetical protein